MPKRDKHKRTKKLKHNVERTSGRNNALRKKAERKKAEGKAAEDQRKRLEREVERKRREREDSGGSGWFSGFASAFI